MDAILSSSPLVHFVQDAIFSSHFGGCGNKIHSNIMEILAKEGFTCGKAWKLLNQAHGRTMPFMRDNPYYFAAVRYHNLIHGYAITESLLRGR